MKLSDCIRWLCQLALIAALFAAAPLYAQQCTHLRQAVNCPPGVPAGSNSVFFGADGSVNFSTPGGVLINIPGNLCCTPFVPVVPGAGAAPAGPAVAGSGNPFQPSNSTGQTALTAPGPDFSLGNDGRRENPLIGEMLGETGRALDFLDNPFSRFLDGVIGLFTGESLADTTEKSLHMVEEMQAEDARTAGTPSPGVTFEAPPPPLE